MASDTTRRLMLMRHAKADWPDVPDQRRPLAKRGRNDAPVIGRWLREHGYLPDVVICSSARRTRQTWELVAPELGGSPKVTFDDRAYDAGEMSLLYLARELPASCQAGLLIGHNPAISDLAASLTEPSAGNAAGDAAGDAAGGAAEDAAGDAAEGAAEDAAGGAAAGAANPLAGVRFPTAAVAVLEFAGDWADLAPGGARLLDFAAPARG
jgi:phosphohistidine phosphatase